VLAMSAHSPSPADRAKEKLRARAERIARLRRRVAAVALATFAVAFGAIAYDGSMGTTASSSASQQAAVTSTTTSSSAGTTTTDDSTSSDDSTSTSSDDSTSTSSDDSSSTVSTQQS
jgi:hypothetical protein